MLYIHITLTFTSSNIITLSQVDSILNFLLNVTIKHYHKLTLFILTSHYIYILKCHFTIYKTYHIFIFTYLSLFYRLSLIPTYYMFSYIHYKIHLPRNFIVVAHVIKLVLLSCMKILHLMIAFI